MTFGKKKLFSLFLVFNILTSTLELTHANFLGTTTLVSFCTYILLPGSLISLILRIKKLSFWENLLFIVGLSIAFLEFGGLLLNTLLPLFNVENPLAFQNLVYGFDVFLLILFIAAWVRTQQLEVKIQLPKRSNIEKRLYIVPIFFPILATLGAIVLNNGGSDILTLILLGAIAVYGFLLVLFRDKIAVDLYPYAVFFIGLASLFTTSLRSWYITGHDIEIEFYVFQLTNAHHVWNMAFYQDAYNACLSITILPTVLTNLLLIQEMYVYKVVFQIVFAISPILVFFIIRNYTIPVIAFLSAFLFISFPTFFNDMPMLNRQEIGFFFFGLVLYIILLSNLSFSVREKLFIIFGFSVVVSHYSTNFVLLALVAFVYVLTRVISLSFVKNIFARLLSTFHITLKNTYTNWYESQDTIVLPKISRTDRPPKKRRPKMFLNLPQRTGTGSPPRKHYPKTLNLPQRTQIDHSPKRVFERPAFQETSSGSLGQLDKPLQTGTKTDRGQEEKKTTTWYANEETVVISKVNRMLLSLPLILTLFVMTFFWNNLYTNSSNHAGSVLSEVVSGLLVKSKTNTQSDDLSYSIFSHHKKNLQEQLKDYINSTFQAEGSTDTGQIDTSDFYSKSITSKYPSYPIDQEQLAPTPLGNLLTTLHIPVFDVQAELRSLSADFMQLFVVIGLFAIFFFKNKKPFDLYYLLLCFGSLFLLALIIVLPDLSAEYGLLRMFQQLLFILSLLIVIGIRSILFFIKEEKRLIVAGIIAMIFFLNLTGFISHLTGDYYPQLTLDNSGLYYDTYYVHKSDIVAIIWLTKNNVDNAPVDADLTNVNKLLTYGDINALDADFPPIIQKDAYVYQEVAVFTIAPINNDVQIFNSSKPFLDNNKNLVYSNGKNNIYK